MINFLHAFTPEPILISIGPFSVYWYGIFIVTGILLAILVIFKLADFYKIPKNTIIDLIFYLIIGGIIGARIYHVFLELPYYLNNPLNTVKFWNGGLAIHGALLFGIIILWLFTKKKKLNFWQISAILAPGLALAQAVGRWGNYFNQEIFGKPTNLSWGIPIEPANRMIEFYNAQFFHPTFLYESIGSFIIFTILIIIHIYIIKNKKTNNYYFFLTLAFYLTAYSFLRFCLEFIRIDITPIIFGLRTPQIASLLIILVIFLLLPKFKKNVNLK
ncbi:prolipoprotein diacylglyceryl transferase [Candidatus Falkowbacteria bacterium]|nr:MAG: prolipoprotein diacylglyceryl transferase [Candidatus Falkowbacteria bacterium]